MILLARRKMIQTIVLVEEVLDFTARQQVGPVEKIVVQEHQLEEEDVK